MDQLKDLIQKLTSISNSLDKVTQMFNWLWQTGQTILDWILTDGLTYIKIAVGWLANVLVIAFDFLLQLVKDIAAKI
ncbi:MAG TPA: hypothetical protein VJH70_01885 [Candidatus Paceibacterota bacterium]